MDATSFYYLCLLKGWKTAAASAEREEKYWIWRITLTETNTLQSEKKSTCPCYFPCQVHELQKPIFCLLSRGKGSDNFSILQLITVSEAKSVKKKIERGKNSSQCALHWRDIRNNKKTSLHWQQIHENTNRRKYKYVKLEQKMIHKRTWLQWVIYVLRKTYRHLEKEMLLGAKEKFRQIKLVEV